MPDTQASAQPAAPEPTPASEDPRFSRYSGLVSPDAIRKVRTTIIGCGAIGRQVGMTMAAMGFNKFMLVDIDRVGPENVGTQGYTPQEANYDADEGIYKVGALFHQMTSFIEAASHQPTASNAAYICQHIAFATANDLNRARRYFARSDTATQRNNRVIVCAVDSLATRRELFQAAIEGSTKTAPKFQLWLDARMSAEEFEIYAVVPERKSVARYLRSLDENVGPPMNGAACTARSTFYCAGIAANFLVSQIVRWLRGDPLVRPFKMHIPSLSMDFMEYLNPPPTPPVTGGNPTP